MTTYTYSGIFYTVDASDNVDEFRTATISSTTAPGIGTLSYSYENAQVSGQETSIIIDNAGTEFYSSYVDDYMLIPTGNRIDYITEIAWNDGGTARTSYVLSTEDTSSSGGRYSIQLGGDPLPVFTDAASLTSFISSITSQQDVPPGSPFAAGQDIDLASIPAVTITEDDRIYGTDGNDSLLGGEGADSIYGYDGADTLIGGDGNDFIRGYDGDDLIDSSTGSVSTNFWGDYIQPGRGNNTILGNADLFLIERDGIDIGYQDLSDTGGLVLTVGENGTGTVVSNIAGVVNDTFTYAHRFDGSQNNDVFNGSANSNWEGWAGRGGDDTLNGNGGYDELLYQLDYQDGGNGGVTVNFATGIATDPYGSTDSFTGMEAARGTAQNDVMIGSASINYISYDGLDGNDTITGTSGTDRADYYDDVKYGGTAGIIADLAAGTIQDSFGAIDSVSMIDQVRGTNQADSMTAAGSSAGVRFEGEGGNDTLIGGSGRDSLRGGEGDDFLNAGDAVENDWNDIAAGAGNDTVTFTDLTSGGYGSLGHWDLSSGITTNLDGVAGTASIDKQDEGLTTILSVNNALNGNGLGLGGTQYDDVFNFLLASGQWTEMAGEGGDNTYNINAATEGGLRISYHDAESGIVADLTTGTVQNGYGGTDTIVKAASQYLEIRGSNFADQITGGSADESFIGRGGNDTIDGGAGFDRVRFDRSNIEGGVNVNLAAGTATGTWNDQAFTNSLTSIEKVVGTYSGNDTIVGDDQNNEIEGRGGNDLIDGAAGNDTLEGGDGNDILTGGLGNDSIIGGDGTDTAVFSVASGDIEVTAQASGLTITSADGTDFISNSIESARFSDQTISYADLAGLVAAETITGTDMAENIDGSAAAENIQAGDGGDWITSGGGNDTVDGGAGRDMLSFFNLADTFGRTNVQYRMDVDMGGGRAVSHDGFEVVQFTSIERFTASIFADRIRGSDGDDEIRGLGDYDWIIATTGNDTIDGGTGQDMISFLEYQSSASNVVADIFSSDGMPPSGAQASGVLVNLADPTVNTGLAEGLSLTSVERVTGSGRQDVFYGDAGENDFRGLGDYDWFVSSAGGRERYFGGDGLDTVTYFNAEAAISASLRNGATVDGRETGYGSQGDAARDLYFEIENLVGSDFGDSLTGSNERNQLNGLDGDDIIFGYGGVDYLKGGAGNDTIDGGDASDYALFNGNHADYTLTRDGDSVTSVGIDGTDILTNVEYFRFDDEEVSIWNL